MRKALQTDLKDLTGKAGDAARLLKLLANEHRLLILCQLAAGEASVGALADAVGLSQSALSQHLAKMREDEIVVTRREAQTMFYRIADRKVAKLLAMLKDIFCR